MQGNEQLVSTIAEMYEEFCRLEPFDGQAPMVERYIKKRKPQCANTEEERGGYNNKTSQASSNIENEHNNWQEDWDSRWNTGAYNQEWNWPHWENGGNWWTNGWSNGWCNGWQDNEWHKEEWDQDEPRNWPNGAGNDIWAIKS